MTYDIYDVELWDMYNEQIEEKITYEEAYYEYLIIDTKEKQSPASRFVGWKKYGIPYDCIRKK